MTETEKLKRKRAPERWWQFPQSFSYRGEGTLETLIPHLQGYHRYEWQGGNVCVEIEEIEADQDYRFMLTYDKRVSSGQYHTVLSGRIAQYVSRTFVIEGTSIVEPSGLTNLAFYMLVVIFISLPVALTESTSTSGLPVMLILSAPMLLPLVSHLWRRHTLLERVTQILHHYEVYGPNVVLEPEQQPLEHPLEADSESRLVFEDGILKEKGKGA